MTPITGTVTVTVTGTNIDCPNGQSSEQGAPSAHNPIDLSPLMTIFNSNCPSLPNISRMTEQRKAAVITWHPTEDEFIRLCQRIEASDFLTGRLHTDRQWAASFDWILKPQNRQKIFEGQYDNRTDNWPTTGGSGRRGNFDQRTYSDSDFDALEAQWIRKKQAT